MKVYFLLVPLSLLLVLVGLYSELSNNTPSLILQTVPPLEPAPPTPYAIPPTPYAVPPQLSTTPAQSWVQSNVLASLSLRNKPAPATNHWDLSNYDCKKNSYHFPALNILYSGVPQSGCSNWLAALMLAEGRQGNGIHEWDMNAISNLKPNVIELIHGFTEPYRIYNIEDTDLASLQDVPSFTIVRNPWVRMVSGYRNKLSNEVTQGSSMRGYGVELVAWARNISEEEVREKDLYPTFGEFVDLVLWKKLGLNEHFAPQYKFLGLQRVRYDYIGSLELLEHQQREIMSLFKLNIAIFGSYDKSRDPLKKVQKSVLLAKKWFKEVDGEKIERLYELFKPDFMLYNYSNFSDPDFPLPLHHQDENCI